MNMKYSRGAAGNDFFFFIFFIIVLGIVWGLTGGPDRSISREGPFLNPPFPLGDGTAYNVPGVSIPSVNTSEQAGSQREDSGGISGIISRIRGGVSNSSEKQSPYAGMVSLSVGRAKDSDENKEYVTLKTSKSVEGRITISDWRIESTVSLIGTTLGGAAYLPYSGQVNQETPLALGPNTTVYVVSGRSPIGASFRVNSCTGYFAQFQEFNPDLKKECPSAEIELETSINADFVPNESCLNFVEDIDRCELTLTSVPVEVGGACQDFIFNELTYNGCVQSHKSDPDFYKNEWRVYLDRDQELWKSSNERIRLLDENGLVVDAITY